MTAQDFDASVYAPEQVMSKDQYWVANYAGKKDGILKNPAHYNDFNYKIAKFFGSKDTSKFESEYDAYINRITADNEFKATQSARAWEKYLDDTKVQRLVKDIYAAGLNPWLAVQNGISTSGVSSAAKADYKYSNPKDTKKGDTGRDLALFMIAAAKLIALLA